MISLCIKYDIDSFIIRNRGFKIEDLTFSLFYLMTLAYGTSLVLVYCAMIYFSHPQPALVFIVPICTLTLGIFGLFKDNKKVWTYDSSIITKSRKKSKRTAIKKKSLSKIKR
jgi:minor histocompatibility antigen H13